MITAGYIRTVDPVIEPLTLDEAKQQARITDDRSNDLLVSYIRAAREEAEATLGYGLLTQTWRMDLSAFAEIIYLPMAVMVQSVTHIKYYDTAGTLQTLSSANYLLETSSRPTRIARAPGMAWPALQADRLTARVQITYVAGWARAQDVPERIRQGMRLWVTYLDLDRDGLEPGALAARSAASLCWSDALSWYPPCE